MNKILVVDDTKNIRMILTKCLELEGYEVVTASNGKQALDLLMATSFDLAFLDIKLPEMRGTEVLKRIRSLGIKTPVIIITAYATVKNAIDCTNLGAVAYIQKPFSVEKIKSVLKEMENNLTCSQQDTIPIEELILEAKTLLGSKSYDKALEILKKILSIEINNPEIYLLISKAYKGMESLENSERFYQLYKSYNI